ncbi:MAG: hypothetical protein A3F82_00340 [Deltaproteobacteria bacterium RIFCSPLOWO2_12_FULL_44_12]|nr:MAG: hypothetical protein A2712_04615 [Deltaproteobacteria bacterium RIFCSPHIGHO2_01_FULL_43_49]OGQ16462.1 MAG: hypothetical protein A3D22_02580 [Deltaproteobacteria bacterium RIFCSPHIGHO2_02_FULL_44_53]OGQ27710.1 MAG: hypothetical protein A3D98_08405 [Deltaproteobacteria bacterium RIFCSPHIGHO2_12_FULL_44_21]OGQ32980.1 MAG: hypothetical protein A2979_10510 [Deltaproteobacteria bacterium RIFCSPLOWO2_01_FULL_45_74]OGQ42081.1 MAG: hypothetical protein A3I70_10300 [Deltaproteobacteria bacterium 
MSFVASTVLSAVHGPCVLNPNYFQTPEDVDCVDQAAPFGVKRVLLETAQEVWGQTKIGQCPEIGTELISFFSHNPGNLVRFRRALKANAVDLEKATVKARQALFDSVTFTIFYYAAAIYVGTLGSELVKAEETMRVVVAPLAVCSFFLFLDMTVRNGINCLTILVRGKPWGFSKEPWMFRLL